MAGPRTFAAILPPITKAALGRHGMAFGSLLAEWTSVVTPRAAECTLPLRLVFPKGRREEAVLHLRVTPSYAVDLQHLGPLLIEMVNSFFGYKAVAHLKMIQAQRPLPSPRAPRFRRLSAAEIARIDAAVRTIPDEALAATVASFGRTLLARVNEDASAAVPPLPELTALTSQAKSKASAFGDRRLRLWAFPTADGSWKP